MPSQVEARVCGRACAREKYGAQSWFRAQKVKGKEDKMRLKGEEGTDKAGPHWLP